ncbi:DJ-1/PfpI family protein [Mucilaginibacter sp.]|uniref:DJ-1/PfpI family protein n=1 Tax=Mucilaginibacter sp. TaxID=1882438 RepID=UPI003B00BC2F
MKNFKIIVLLLIVNSALKAQMAVPAYTKQLNVAVFIYPGVGLGDLDGPVDVFTKAGRITKGQYKVYTVAFKPAMITTQGGTLKLIPDYTTANMPKPDILVFPGGTVGLADSMRRDQQVINFIQQYQNKVEVLMSVCTAAYFVGQAGVFDGHKVTTHFFQADDLQAQFPESTVVKDVRFVDEGKLITASGVTSGIDASLHLVARFSGQQVEKLVEGAIQYTMHEHEKWPEAIGGMKFDRDKRKKMGLLAQ